MANAKHRNPKLKILVFTGHQKVAEELVRKIVRDPLDDIDISRAVQVLVKKSGRKGAGI